jgi:tetratricopeptide (TPR) repeat protein
MYSKITLFPVMVVALSLAFPAQAQTQRMVIENGKVASASRPEVGGDQVLMLEAVGKVMQRDYRAAETLYSQAIAQNAGNLQAYIQRGLIRRELKDGQGAQSDGRAVVTLADRTLQRNSEDADAYQQRAMGYRLQGQFALAKEDMRMALKRQRKISWENDLKAIELEERMSQ